MADGGPWVERTKRVQNGLVRDFSGQPNVPWRDRAGVRAHERATPMRWRSGDVRRTTGAEPQEEIAYRLTGAGQYEGSTTQHRAEEDLKPAVPPDVIERAPHHVVALALTAADRRRQTGETVSEHFRRASRARGQKH